MCICIEMIYEKISRLWPRIYIEMIMKKYLDQNKSNLYSIQK